MKKKVLLAINTILFSYLFYYAPYNLNLFLLLFLAFTVSLIYPFFSFLVLLPLIYFKDPLLLIVISAIIISVILAKAFIIKKKMNIFITFVILLLGSSLIFYYYNKYPISYPFFILLTSSIILFIPFLLNCCLFNQDNKKAIQLISKKIYDLFFIAISVAIAFLGETDYSFIIIGYLLLLCRFITHKYTFLGIGILVLVFEYFTKGSHLIQYSFMLLLYLEIGITNFLLGLAICFIYLITYRLSYQNTLAFIATQTIAFILCYKGKITTQIDETKNTINKINKFISYIDLAKKQLEASNTNSLIDKRINSVIETYCGDCKRYDLCTRKNKTYIYSYFKLALTTDLDIQTVSINQELKNFILACPNYKEITKLDKIIIKPQSAFDSLAETRNVLSNLVEKIESNPSTLHEAFITHLANLGYLIKDYEIVEIDSLIEIYITIEDLSPSYILNVITQQASLFFKKAMQAHVIKQSLNQTTFKLVYKSRLKIMFDHYSLAKDNNQISGDNFIAKKDLNGRYIFALSDGMGSGNRAFSESKEILTMVKEIAGLNLGIKTSIDLLDSYYLYKNQSDMFATLDFLQIDSVNLTANLYKLGSTNTYLLSRGELKIFYNTNLPLGITKMRDEYSFKLQKTDLILLVSDGVTEHIDHHDFQNFLLKNAYKSVNKIVANILDYVYKSSNKKLADDLSVIAIKIC